MPAPKPFAWFLERVLKHSDKCWTLPKHRPTNAQGYVRIKVIELPRRELAHRAFWHCLKAELPSGKKLSNRCGRHACVNPEHWTDEAKRAQRTHCSEGHPWVRPLKDGRGSEYCRFCAANARRRWLRTRRGRTYNRRTSREYRKRRRTVSRRESRRESHA